MKEWWKDSYCINILRNQFKQHIIGLFLRFEVNNEIHFKLYSGLFLYYKNVFFWMTAGHVFDELNILINSNEYNIKQMHWIDNCEEIEAKSIPVSNYNLKLFSTNEIGIDFGLAKIPYFDLECIKKNKNIKIISEEIWVKLDQAKPDGFYLVGYPSETMKIFNQSKINKMFAELYCIPIEKTTFNDNASNKEFWNDPNGFYAKILFYNNEYKVPKNISGMSGGPIFSIEYSRSNNFVYRLFGIQRSWEKESLTIRAEPIRNILSIIDITKK